MGIFPTVATTLLLADAAAIKVSCNGKLLLKGHYYNLFTQEVTSSRALFPKPLENSDYKALSFYGPNILVSEHEDWKKYRKISAPGFSEVSPPCVPIPNLISHINIGMFFS
jgi:hypothetical protein